jgi:hypothetical protein
MAESMDIFIASDLPVEAFVREAGSLLQIQFNLVKDERQTWYEAISDQGRITIGTHEFENDRDMKFEEFNYVISFWVNRGLDINLIEPVRQKIGRQIYETFKQTGKYALMLVDDVQRKLDEFRPSSGWQGQVE